MKRIEVAFHVSTDSPAEDRRSELLTGDENILQVTMVVQYRIRRPEQYLFSADGPDRLVRLAVETAMNQCVSRLPVDAVLTTAKSEIQSEAVETAQRLLDAYGCGVALLGGSLHEVAPPAPVSEAFKDVASAKKDSERAASEAREYVEKAVKKAGGDAQAQLSRVEGYRARRVEAARGEASHFLSLLAEYRRAREVTRTRLYVDAMERILSRAKVVIIGSEEAGVAPKITVVDSPAEAPATAPAAPAD